MKKSTKTPKWVRDKMPRKSSVLKFNFKKFLDDTGMTVEEFNTLINYSVLGTVRMLARGTIKKSTFTTLSQACSGAKLPDPSQYIMEKK